MINNKRFGIALSGGGYRAAGFHLGTLKKLSELGLMSNVDVMSTISGGSITGAAYCLHKGSFQDFENKMIRSLSEKNVIGYLLTSWGFIRLVIIVLMAFILTIILLFSKWAPLAIFPMPTVLFLILKYQFALLPVSEMVEKAYDKFFYHGATLKDLCEKPEIAIGSTNLHTGRQFTFSKRKMEDSYYAFMKPTVKFNGQDFPISRAVIASSCVPFAFTPIEIEAKYFSDVEQSKSIKPRLIDGGVYDNQGIHKIAQPNSSYACDVILVSDAGNNLILDGFYNNTITLLLRTVNLFMGRIKNFQMMQSIYQKNTDREVAYHSLGWDIEQCIPGFVDNLCQQNVSKETIQAHGIPSHYATDPNKHRKEIIQLLNQNCQAEKILARKISKKKLTVIRMIGTNLTPIKEDLIRDMISYSADMTELQLRLYCPSLFPTVNIPIHSTPRFR